LPASRSQATRFPPPLLNPIGLKAASLYPLGNGSPSIYESTQIAKDNYNQGGFRFDHYFGNSDQLFARYAISALDTFDPLPINGSNVPGFPVANNITTNSFTLSQVHLISPRTVQTVRLAFFRNVFGYADAQNHTSGSSLDARFSPIQV
jgi:hypothetical protein